MDPTIRCLTGSHHQLCGPACTVKVFPGDNLMVHKSLDVAKPGDVVVVDAGRSYMNAVLGDLISNKGKHRKIAGFVVDGLVRDLPGILEIDYPVFARGTTPVGPLHRGPGEVNFPICCGGVVVNPGDLIVADAAGVVVVPREIAAELLDRLKQHEQTNAAYLAAVKRGDFSNAWVDRTLAEHDCPLIPGPRPTRQRPRLGTRGGFHRGGRPARLSGRGDRAGLDETLHGRPRPVPLPPALAARGAATRPAGRPGGGPPRGFRGGLLARGGGGRRRGVRFPRIWDL